MVFGISLDNISMLLGRIHRLVFHSNIDSMKNLTKEKIDQIFIEFYLKKETIPFICRKYAITRYRFYKLKKAYPKKSFYDYSLQDWVRACKEIEPDGTAMDIRNYLSYVNKMEYALDEIENILSTI